ncbi:hypothetical protein AURDEDRAFT_114939 [Auricularia subglabra TFB-10046 SS5]|nr:hypothetical protein AURDEDRAFT_114939 [Auricularia subglabra TFB-10046 SS5]
MSTNGAPKARVSKQQLLKNLAILDSIPNVLISHTIPPSPPPSRDSSPSLKRKHEADTDLANKRARVAVVSQTPPSPPTSPPEVTADFTPTPVVPVKHLGTTDDSLHYSIQGKMFKRSSESRANRASSMPAGESRDHEIRLSLLESLDSYLNFTYNFWMNELIEPNKPTESALKAWRSLRGMYGVVRGRAESVLRHAASNPGASSFRERLAALMAMLDRLQGFIYSNVSRWMHISANDILEPLMHERRASSSPHGQHSSTPVHHASPPGQQPTPPTLPSPVSVLTPPSSSGPSVPLDDLQKLKEALDDARTARVFLAAAADSPLLRPKSLQRLFPHTYRRIDLSRRTNGGFEEFGLALDRAAAINDTVPVELAVSVLEWPTAPGPGPGSSIGAVCCALRAMLWEFGRDIGYAGRSTTFQS